MTTWMESMPADSALKGRLREAVQAFSSSSILVVGDIMLDQFVWGEVSRISPEAPVPVVNVQDETFLLGGAANVANNLRSLGAGAFLSGVIGRDSFGRLLRDLAGQNGVDTAGLVEASRPTTLKTRILARGQQVVRVDREEKQPLSNSVVDALTSQMKNLLGRCSCVIVSDYHKGVVSSPLMKFLVRETADRQIHLLVDPKPANYHLYQGATLITPNQKEAMAMASMKISGENELERAAMKIAGTLGAQGVLITRGARGMTLWQADKGIFSIPTMAREVFDVTGAGDTVISVIALGLAAGLRMCEAAYLANIAAGIVVGKVGTAVADRKELLDAIERAPCARLNISGK